ncbi:MAG TPA: carboxypeptidase-like regulatory domain-containing protein [Acidobacteriaceae bacterium]|nr:carboxypeptidase-like regulatory domain-containing protein [Acidobacteriaceae bacterium]
MSPRNPPSSFLCLLLLLVFLTAPGIIRGQATTTGNLSGTVTDVSGALVPNATLTIKNPAVGASVTQHSNSQGGYTFSDLQVGTYTLTVNAPGFASTVIQSVVIDTGRSVNVNPTLKVGSANDQVSVTSNAQVLETTTNTLAATIRPDSVQQLPLNGRDASPLTQLAPGAQTPGDARYGTFNALPTGAINITIDGMNSNFQKFRTASSGNYSPAPVRLGAIEEVSVSTGSLTADSGAEGAVAVRYQIKRGTNQWHGSAFWEFQSSALNANSWLNDARKIKKNKFHYNDEGGNIGGPLWKNKLFLFVNYEQRLVPGNTQGSGYALTADAQAGNITYTDANKVPHTTNVLTVLGQRGYPSTPNARTTQELAAVNKYNQTSQFTAGSLPYQNNVSWFYPTNSTNIYPTTRMDWQIKPTMDFHVAYDLWWRKLPGTQVYNGDPVMVNNFKSSYQTITAGFDWTITPHIVNQVNFGLLNDQEHYSYDNSYNPYASVNNIIYNSPSFTNGGVVLTPTIPTNALTEPRNNPVRDIFDNVTWNKGKHTFTFGGDYRNASGHDLSLSNPPAQTVGINTANDPINAEFNSTNFPGLITTGTSTPDLNNLRNLYAMLTGRLNGISGRNNLDSATKQFKTLGALTQLDSQTVGGFYVQDNWRLSPHLAINAGFRWQFSGALHTPSAQFLQPKLADLLGPSTAPFQPGQLNGVANPMLYAQASTYSADLVQPAPNVGFAWNPSMWGGKVVVRGGAAISYYDEGWQVWENNAFGNPGVSQTASITSNPVSNTQPPGYYSAGSLSLGDTPALLTTPATYSTTLPQSSFTFVNTFSATDPNLKSPQVQNWNLGVQYKIGWDTVVEANYVGNHVIHMWQNFNLNEVNIFENGFLDEFKNAQANYAASGGTTLAGANPTPILNRAFGTGSANFKNSTYLSYAKTGQAGALANVIATNSTFFCNLVGGANFAPCAAKGYTGATQYPINFFIPNPYSSGRATLLSDPGTSNYNGLQMQIKHPVGHGLALQANYAWSHALSNRYANSDQASLNFITLRNKHLGSGPAITDQRHAFNAYAVYSIPFHSSNGIMKQVAGGWIVSPIFTWATGRNFKLLGGTQTVNTSAYVNSATISDSGVNLNGVDVHTLQKKLVGRFKQANTSNPMLLINPAQISQLVSSATTPGQFGQFVFLHSPQFVNTDFAVTKNFPIWENVRLNIQTEFLNIFNHPNFAIATNGNAPSNGVDITASASTLGTGSVNGSSRSIQFRTNISF